MYIQVITHLSGLDSDNDLLYKTREEQGHLLQQVLAASDIDCEDEKVPGEGGFVRPGGSRRTGGISSMSGGDDAVYYEFKRKNVHNVHPLFKKFRG